MIDGSNSVPSAGTRSLDDATDDTKKISSQILDAIGLKGKPGENGPGVSRGCGPNEDPKKFYQMRHTWGFRGPTRDELAGAMKRLKEELPKQGWKIVEYARNNSRNKTLELTADNDKEKFSVKVSFREKDQPPALMVRVISGCYQIPEGQEIDRF